MQKQLKNYWNCVIKKKIPNTLEKILQLVFGFATKKLFLHMFFNFSKKKIGTNQNFGCEFVRWSVDDKNVNLLENMWIVLHHKNFTLTSRSRVHYNKFTLLWPFVNLLCLSCLLLDEVSQIHFNKFTNYVNNFTLKKWWLQITCVLSYCHKLFS